MTGGMPLASMLNGNIVPTLPIVPPLPPPLPPEPLENASNSVGNPPSNPSSSLHDISPLIKLFSQYMEHTGDIYAPPEIADALRGLASRLPNPDSIVAPHLPRPSTDSTFPSSTPKIPTSMSSPTRIMQNVKITKRITVAELFVYEDPSAFVDFPRTSAAGIGYLFRQDVNNWRHPHTDFVYSLGAPGGSSGDQHRTTRVLVDSGQTSVPCRAFRKTCQGVKVCPQADIEALQEPHCVATPELLQERLYLEREDRDSLSTPLADIYNRTSAFYTALQRVGCHAHEQEETDLTVQDEVDVFIRRQVQLSRRGYQDAIPRCQGRIIYTADWEGKPLVQCEHFDATRSRDHYRQYINDCLDKEYLEALLLDDEEEICRIEDAATLLGYGPNVDCTSVVNATSQRICCPFNHRDSENRLYQPLLQKLPCSVSFKWYEPLEEFRTECPYILYVITGSHAHPIPLPTKTPPRIRAVLTQLFEDVGEDLADMTVRRFLRHPVVVAFVRKSFPNDPLATLADLHASLANRAHLHHFLKSVKDVRYPHGTGWKGVLHLYHIQVEQYPVEAQYIRKIIEVDVEHLTIRGDDECTEASDGVNNLKIIICMTSDQSHRLLKAQYLQCDISFKRIVGQREFILAGLDRNANMAITYCRVYMNCETAFAHCRVFQEIDNIVEADTGSELQWRHLHAAHIDERDGYSLAMIGDSHGGQGCGFGLYLKGKAQRLLGYDLHEPSRLLKDLSEYKHLHRCYRVCEVHYDRNIDESKKPIPKVVRPIMKGLACISHPDWDGALAAIRSQGEKAGNDWLDNKINSKFVFQGICQEKSFIPLDIWKAGDSNDNIVETSHSNVNFEGRACTLVGGLEKGKRFDAMQIKALRVYEDSGVRTSYASGHRFENSVKAVKRHFLKQHRKISAQDAKIQKHNRKVNEAIQRANELTEKGRQEWSERLRLREQPSTPQNEKDLAAVEARIHKAQVALTKVKEDMAKLVVAGAELAKEKGGSGLYSPLMPESL